MSKPSLIDVEAAILTMSKEDRDICYMLAEGYTKKEISESMGIDRSTLYRRHIKAIRAKLQRYSPIRTQDQVKRKESEIVTHLLSTGGGKPRKYGKNQI